MGDKTAIEWTDATWNPTTGCDRISPGCDNCYALSLAKRLKAMGSPRYQLDGDERTSGPGFALTVHHDSVLTQPLRWTKPRMIFVNSMSDLFHADVPDEFIVEVFAIMAVARQHTFQLLTKRPKRMMTLLSQIDLDAVEDAMADYTHADLPAWPLPNVWLGTSIESDRYAWRAKHLRNTPAAVRFISAEPLLGPLPSLELEGIDWVIVGGESGPGARPMGLSWVRDLRDEILDMECPECGERLEWAPEDYDHRPECVYCSGRGVGPAFHFKQMGSVVAREIGLHGKGADFDDPLFPDEFKIREYPRTEARNAR